MPGVVLDGRARVDEKRVALRHRLDEGDLDGVPGAAGVLAQGQLPLGVDADDSDLLGDVTAGDAALLRVAEGLGASGRVDNLESVHGVHPELIASAPPGTGDPGRAP